MWVGAGLSFSGWGLLSWWAWGECISRPELTAGDPNHDILWSIQDPLCPVFCVTVICELWVVDSCAFGVWFWLSLWHMRKGAKPAPSVFLSWSTPGGMLFGLLGKLASFPMGQMAHLGTVAVFFFFYFNVSEWVAAFHSSGGTYGAKSCLLHLSLWMRILACTQESCNPMTLSKRYLSAAHTHSTWWNASGLGSFTKHCSRPFNLELCY